MNEDDIKTLVELEVVRAKRIVSQRWRIPYRGFEMSKAKTIYGQATHDGKVRISMIFLGTNEHAELKDTVRHEIAHLVCGMDADHNYHWQYVARQLGCTPKRSKPFANELKQAAKKQWRLIGILEDGTEVRFHASHVQQAKYLKPDKTFRCNQGKVVKCKYVRNIW